MPNLLLTMWDTIKSSNIGILVAAGLGMFAVIGGLSMLSYHYTLSGIKSRTVGDGQHGTARWATDKEIRQTYAHVPFKVRDWRKGVNLPTEQGLVLGCKGKKDELTALVDGDDIHCLMIAASGAGKTAFFLYPNLEYGNISLWITSCKTSVMQATLCCRSDTRPPPSPSSRRSTAGSAKCTMWRIATMPLFHRSYSTAQKNCGKDAASDRLSLMEGSASGCAAPVAPASGQSKSMADGTGAAADTMKKATAPSSPCRSADG